MNGHLERAQIQALLVAEGSRTTRVAVVRHLLAGCGRCAALAREVLRENCYRLENGRVDPCTDIVPAGDYDEVFDRLMQRLPELKIIVAPGHFGE
jgi:bacterioferritin-associated ferredoxin